MQIEYRRYDKTTAFQNGITLTVQPCIFTSSAKASEMRGLMSCGHAVECMNLYSYCYHSILHDKYEIRCPALLSDDPRNKCNKKWTYDEIRRMCMLTPQDRDFFEMALNTNRIQAEGNVKRCPTCHNFVRRLNSIEPWVFCQSCNIIDPNNLQYCFDCGATKIEVKGQTMYQCQTEQCKAKDEIKFPIPDKMIGGKMRASIIRCPNTNCNVWIEHAGPSYCKIVTCLCNHRFCFVCKKGGNVNSFNDCSTVEGGCKIPEDLEELISKPIKKDRPQPLTILPPPAGPKNGDESVADTKKSIQKRDQRLDSESNKITPNNSNMLTPNQSMAMGRGRGPMPPPNINKTISDKELAKDGTNSNIRTDKGSRK